MVADGDGSPCHYASFGSLSGPVGPVEGAHPRDPRLPYDDSTTTGDGAVEPSGLPAYVLPRSLQLPLHHHHHHLHHQQHAAGLVAHYFGDRHPGAGGYAASGDGFAGDLNNNEQQQPGEEFEFYDEKKCMYLVSLLFPIILLLCFAFRFHSVLTFLLCMIAALANAFLALFIYFCLRKRMLLTSFTLTTQLLVVSCAHLSCFLFLHLMVLKDKKPMLIFTADVVQRLLRVINSLY